MFWRNPSRQAALFWTALLLLCGTAAFIGAVHTKIFGHDIFVLLDNGWRVLNGQRPHADYASPWGPVTFLIAAFGLILSRHSVDGIGYGNASFALLVGTWCWLLGRRRLEPLPRIALGLFIAALAASPYPLGLSPFDSSHAMVYNRYGYTLLGLILLEGFPWIAGRGRKAGEWSGGISTGAALALLLFLKVSFFFIGIPIIGLTLARRRLSGIFIGWAAVSMCFVAYLRFDLADMFRDLRMAAAVRSEAIGAAGMIWHALDHASALLAVVLFALVASLALDLGRWRLPLAGVVLFGADIALLSTNTQKDSLPVLAIFAILIIDETLRSRGTAPDRASRPWQLYYAAALCLGATLFVPQFASDLTGLGYGALRKAWPSKAQVVRFASPVLQPLMLYDGSDPESNGRIFTTYVNDGVALLERVTSANDRVLTMDMTNPFPYALQRQPPSGGMAAVTYGTTLNERHHPSAEQYFGNADVVLVPKHPAQDRGFYDGFFKVYEGELKARFHVASETEWWYLLRRN